MPASKTVHRVLLAFVVLVAMAAPAAAFEEDPGWDLEGIVDEVPAGSAIDSATGLAIDIYPMYFPHVDGITSGYSDTWGAPRSGGRTHEGTDIMAPKMTPIVAVASGTVGWMHNDQGGNCCAMALNHDDGWASWYIHMNNDTPGTDDGQGWGFAPGIEPGVHVEAGQHIGWVGDSGNAEWTGSHTHFELHMPGGVKINPYPHLLEATILPSDPPEVTLRGCDFENDGFDDLVVGVPYEDRMGRTDDGMVTVVPGGEGGPSGEGATAWHQGKPGVGSVPQADDRFGSATGCGDFDGDGFDDLVVGVPGEDRFRKDAGALNVLYGGEAGLAAVGDSFWHQNSPGVPDANNKNDALGSAVAVGDFNGDGFDDVAAGAPGEKVDGHAGAGMVLIFDGAEGGIGTGSVTQWSQATPNTVGIAEAGDGFGRALVAGDFNGDGYADLAIGAPEEDHAAVDAGFVTVLYGASSGLAAASSQRLAQGVDGVAGNAATGERFGAALASGDVNGDGNDDLVVGAPGESTGGHAGAGAVHLLFGSAGGISTNGDVALAGGDGDIPAASAGAALGTAVVVGDFNADGYQDVAAGAPGTDDGAGQVVVLKGTAGAFNGTGARVFTQDSPGLPSLAEPGDAFGARLGVGTFNGGNYSWLAIGVPSEDLGGAADAGIVHALRGRAAGLGTTGDVVLRQNTPGIPGAIEAGDGFGRVARVGH
jgi:hypothetical protein